MELLQSSLTNECGKLMVAKAITGTAIVYSKTNNFYGAFYLPLFQ